MNYLLFDNRCLAVIDEIVRRLYTLDALLPSKPPAKGPIEPDPLGPEEESTDGESEAVFNDWDETKRAHRY